MSDATDRYTDMFLDEAGELIEELNHNLLTLERQGATTEVINEVFRTAHTLKSSAAFVGLDNLSELAHHMEDVLQEVKDNKIVVTTELINLLFDCLDKIKETVSRFGAGEKPTESFDHLLEQLGMYLSVSAIYDMNETPAAPVKAAPETKEKKGQAPPPPPPPSSPPSATPAVSEAVTAPRELILEPSEESSLFKEAHSPGMNTFLGYVTLEPATPMKNIRLLLLLQHLKSAGYVFKSFPTDLDLDGDKVYNSLVFIFVGNITLPELESMCHLDSVQSVSVEFREAKGARKRPRREDQEESFQLKTKNIKVSSEKIDYLLNSVGELVITNSSLQKIYEDLLEEFGEGGVLGGLKNKIDQAARIAKDLQSGIMKMRMIPIGTVFNRYTRPVRDLSLELNKEVELEFQGEDTELDKNIIDQLNDPMMHLLRNALDHGIEPIDERRAKGKPVRARLLLNAFQSGNNIYIEIRDDGRGLDPDAILAKAQERGLVSLDATLSEEEILQLVLQPGFSTAKKVTDLSGRGVGMNVVQQMVSNFKGTIQIQNDPGNGCSFILAFPMTLAIISSIIVLIGGEEYAFPLSDVVETIQIARKELTTLQGREIINLRGDILPVFHLSTLLGLESPKTADEFPIVISSSGNRKIGFIVDQMIGKKEIVIKNLEKNFRTVKGLVGACLMGDGSIVAVLDVVGLLEIAQGDTVRHRLKPNYESLENLKKFNEFVVNLLERSAERGTRKLRQFNRKEQEQEKEKGEESPAKQAVPVGVTAGEAVSTDVGSSDNGGSYDQEIISDMKVNIEQGSSPDMDDRLTSALMDFQTEKTERIARARDILVSEDHTATPAITDEEYNQLYAVINTGMINAGFVLSQLLGVKVEVSVPEFQGVEFNELKEYIPHDDVIAVTLDTTGEYNALLLLVFDEGTAYRAAGDLMGMPVDAWIKGKIPDEDVYSVLTELSNIVGSSILNALANKTGLTIYPSVPGYIHGQLDDLLAKLEEMRSQEGEMQVLYASTDFFREDMELLGRMFFLPSGKTLTKILARL